MFDWLLGQNRERLGVDLGASNIKMVELGREGGRLILRNYALAKTKSGEEIKIDKLTEKELAEILKNMAREAGFKSNQASFSLPVGKSFSTLMDLPMMPEKELAAAVPFEAQKYVPVPLENVVLDWSVVARNSGEALSAKPEEKTRTEAGSPRFGEAGKMDGLAPEKIPAVQNSPSSLSLSGQISPDSNIAQKQISQALPSFGQTLSSPGGIQKSGIQIMLVAVPKEIINFLTKAAELAGLKVLAFEHEAFSLARSLVGNDSGTYLIADLGPKSADIVIVDQQMVKASHSLEAATKEAILMEIDRVVNFFQTRYNRKVNQCLLAGGRATEKETRDFLASKLRLPLKVGDPFARIQRSPNLEKILKEELGPPLAVAVGLAMRED